MAPRQELMSCKNVNNNVNYSIWHQYFSLVSSLPFTGVHGHSFAMSGLTIVVSAHP